MVLAYEARMSEESRREKESIRESSRQQRRSESRARKLRGLTSGSRNARAAAEGSIAALARAESRGKPGVFAHPALTPSEVSLPPDVEGKRRGDLLLVLGPLVVANAGSTAAGFRDSDDATAGPPRTTLCYRFWGQEDLREGNYVSIEAVDSSRRAGAAPRDTCVAHLHIPIRCSPGNFTRYLQDSQPLQITAFVAGVGACGCEVDLQLLELNKPLSRDVSLSRDAPALSMGDDGAFSATLGVSLEVDYSMLSSFELNEHMANTDATLPLFPVTEPAPGDRDLGNIVAEAAREAAGGEEEGEEREEREEDRTSFGWGPAKAFRAAAGRDAEAAHPRSAFVDSTGAMAGASHALSQPTWDSVLARAQKLSNAMARAIGGEGGEAEEAGAGATAPPMLEAPTDTMAVADPSPCPSITSSVEDASVLGLDRPDLAALKALVAEVPPPRGAWPGEHDPEKAEGEPTAQVEFRAGNEVSALWEEGSGVGGGWLAVRVKEVALASREEVDSDRVVVAVKSSLGGGGGRAAFAAKSLPRQGWLRFDLGAEPVGRMPPSKILLAVEVWQSRAAVAEEAAQTVDVGSCDLLGLATFTAQDVRAIGRGKGTVTKPVADLLRGEAGGTVSVGFEVLRQPEAAVGGASAVEPSAAQGGFQVNQGGVLAGPGGRRPRAAAGTTDHVFEVHVVRATGLFLEPRKEYYLSYTFQSAQEADPLCTKPVALGESGSLELNARAAHTVSLPRGETVLMNLDSFAGGDLVFDLRSPEDAAGRWHATGTLDFMELVEMTCEGRVRAERCFAVPLTRNAEVYGGSEGGGGGSLSVAVRYAAEEDSRQSGEPEAAQQLDDEEEVEEEGRVEEAAPRPPQSSPLREVLLSRDGDEEAEVLALEDGAGNSDIEDFEVRGSNAMKAKVDFSVGRLCGLRTMVSAAAQAPGGSAENLRSARRLGPNTYVRCKFAPGGSYLEELLPSCDTEIQAEQWAPDYGLFRSSGVWLSPSTAAALTREALELEVWHYEPGRRKEGGGRVLLGTCRVYWRGVLTSPRGICGLHPVTCPRSGAAVGALEVAATLQMRSYMLQNSSILDSCDPVREMLPEDFVEANRRSVANFAGRGANFVVAVDKVTVSSPDITHFNRRLRYCVGLSVNGFLQETVGRAAHPEPTSRQGHREELRLSHKAFKSFRCDDFFVAAINNSPLVVRLLERDANRPDVEVCQGEVDLSQLLLVRNTVSQTSRMISGTYTLVPHKGDYVEVRIRVKVLLKAAHFALEPQTGPGEAEAEAEGEEAHYHRSTQGENPELRRSLEALKSLRRSREILPLDGGGSEDGGSGGGPPVEALPREEDDIDVDEDFSGGDDDNEVDEVISLMRSSRPRGLPSPAEYSSHHQEEAPDALVCVEDALHLRGEALGPGGPQCYAYVTLSWPSSSRGEGEDLCSGLAECAEEQDSGGSARRCRWFYTRHLHLGGLADGAAPGGGQQRSFVLRVWCRRIRVTQSIELAMLDEPVRRDPESDVLVGTALVDVSALSSGLDEVHGWYNLLDRNRRCCGQVKARVSLLGGGGARGGRGTAVDGPGLVPGEDEPVMDGMEAWPALAWEEVVEGEEEGDGEENAEGDDQGGSSSAGDFVELTRGICEGLGDLESKILSLDRGAEPAGGDLLGSYGRSPSLEEIYLNNIEFSVENYRHDPSAPPLEEAPLAGAQDRTHTPPRPIGRAAAAAAEEEEDTREVHDLVDSGRPKAFNFDRIARILSAGGGVPLEGR